MNVCDLCVYKTVVTTHRHHAEKQPAKVDAEGTRGDSPSLSASHAETPAMTGKQTVLLFLDRFSV